MIQNLEIGFLTTMLLRKDTQEQVMLIYILKDLHVIQYQYQIMKKTILKLN